MDIQKLNDILQPPSDPYEPGKRDEWIQVFNRVGTRLPIDYEHFVNSYGSGQINRFLCVFNPFSQHQSINLLSQIPVILSGLRESREQFPKLYPYPLYFEPGGVLPWGCSIDGDVFCWLTKGLPDLWPVATVPRGSEMEIFEMPMCLFISSVIEKKINSEAINPHYFSGEAAFTSIKPD